MDCKDRPVKKLIQGNFQEQFKHLFLIYILRCLLSYIFISPEQRLAFGVLSSSGKGLEGRKQLYLHLETREPFLLHCCSHRFPRAKPGSQGLQQAFPTSGLLPFCLFFWGGGSGCLLCSREFTSIPVLPQDVTTSYVSRHCWMFLGGLSCPRRTTVVHEDKCPRILLCERESAFTLRPK